MNKTLNIVLIVVIIVVLGVIVFFGWNMRTSKKDTSKQDPQAQTPQKPAVKFTPIIVENKGKISEERDAQLEKDVQAINDAVRIYATDHNGKYPESYFTNPCTGVMYCLKGVDINTKENTYLKAVPQVKPNFVDYYYRAYNKQKTYCIKTPSVLETANTSVFQCTETKCEKIGFKESCQ